MRTETLNRVETLTTKGPVTVLAQDRINSRSSMLSSAVESFEGFSGGGSDESGTNVLSPS